MPQDLTAQDLNVEDRTAQAVDCQLSSMACRLFELGVLREKGMLPPRNVDADAVRKSVLWLKRQNVKGAEIYIRPCRSVGSALVLVDDLDRAGVEGLAARGLAPTVVTETSRGNHQAWIRLSEEAQPPAVRTAVARHLAAELGGDQNSADFGHFGRLAGYTNRKPGRVVDGRPPFVRLRLAAPGVVAQRGRELVRQALATLEQRKAAAPAVLAAILKAGAALAKPNSTGPHRPLEDLGQWYLQLLARLQQQFGENFDESKLDWMAAGALFERGYSYDVVASVIAQHSPELHARKRNVEEYVIDTAGKAEMWFEQKARGAVWEEIKGQLLTLARERRKQRAREAGQEAPGLEPV